jgi:hypothetical protein
MIIAAIISFGFFVVALPFITALAMLDHQRRRDIDPISKLWLLET